MHTLWNLSWLWLGLGAASAQAQMVEIKPVDAQVWGCLHKGTEPLRYTHEERNLELGGQVRVSLKFTAPDKPPQVDVLFRGVGEALMQKVWFHLQAYRLPCLAPEADPAVAVQEFRFEPKAEAPIAWTAPRAVAGLEADDPQRGPGAFGCMRWPEGYPELGRPDFLASTTNMVVDFTFDHPQQPAKLKVAYSSMSKSQELRIIEFAEQYRMPCVVEGGKTRSARQHFKVLMGNEEPPGFKKELSLREFLSTIKGINSETVNFDFRTMGCPFKVAWTLGKPAIDNSVGEVGKPDLNRAEFLAWLAGLEMNLQKPDFESLMGNALTVNVSCGRLKLGQGPSPAGS